MGQRDTSRFCAREAAILRLWKAAIVMEGP
jgi:hypothetical protein